MRTLRTACFGFAVAMMTASSAHAVGESVGGFPNWRERTLHQFMNRARVDPASDLAACPSANCLEKSCYKAVAPLYYDLKLGRAARFHSDEMKQQGYFAHDSKCAIVSNISTIYPGQCSGAASCACMAGTATSWSARVQLFGTSTSGEIIASPTDPKQAFYLWLYEPTTVSTCGYTSQNGHRYNILQAGPAVGNGVTDAGSSVGDFGGTAGTYKIPSGSHYPQTGASVEMWANWKDQAGPSQAIVNVEGKCSTMSLKFGTAQSGAYLASLTGLGTSCQRYRFEFKDSTGAAVMFPETGAYFIGTGCASDKSDFSSSPPPSCGCTPSCGGKSCGDDGCGSVCGTCDEGQACTDGQCVAIPTDGNPDPIDVSASGCSCDLSQSSSPAAAQLATASMVLGLLLLRRLRKNPV